jgi:L-asparaginase II
VSGVLPSDGPRVAGTSTSPVLAEVVRSGFVESVHRGVLVALDSGGKPLLRAGTVDTPVFPRSSNKPLQAAAMVRAGLELDGKLLALAAASHSGEGFHVAGVREILSGARLGEDALQCPPALPLDEASQHELLRAGAGPDRIHMNCSGKHAAMLATCVAAGWPVGTYLDPAHPLQVRIRQEIERLAAEPVTAVGVDGCGAPLFALSVAGLARAFRSVVLAEPGSAERKVADAMRAYPDWTSGTTRPERALMEAVPGLLLKSGAEGVEGFALADGRAGAFKIEDGNQRARPPVTVALLRMLGADQEPGADRAALDRLSAARVTGGGRDVGVIRAVLPPGGPGGLAGPGGPAG